LREGIRGDNQLCHFLSTKLKWLCSDCCYQLNSALKKEFIVVSIGRMS
jgi:hypothetical protein